MSEVIFDQQNYNGELGTGHGATIHDYGCALCSVAMLLVNSFGKQTDPNKLNQDLINVGGYDSNGAGANDEIVWSTIKKIYSDISLDFNNPYPNSPADMGLIDGKLLKGIGIIAGVSFTHNVNATSPDHYVLIYKKNSDNTYQCLDPWYGDDTSFNARYAVNGMNVAQCILQAISYNGAVASGGAGGNMFILPSGQQVDLANADSMKVCATIWDAVVNLKQYVSASDMSAISLLLGLPAGSNKDKIVATITKLQKDEQTAQTTADNLNKQIPQLETDLKTAQGQVTTIEGQLKDCQNAATHPDTGSTYEQLYNETMKTYNADKIAWDAQFKKDVAVFSQLKTSNIYNLSTGTIFSTFLARITRQQQQQYPPPLTPADFKYADSVPLPPATSDGKPKGR